MRQLILLIFGILLLSHAFAQPNQWTWLSGDSLAGTHNGIYGTKGTAALGNKPGGRRYAACWTDLSGNLWLFGGLGYAATGGFNYLNDLWMYTPASGLWTWIGGSSTVNQNGIYGSKGTPATSSIPGGRASAVTWRDASGNLWLFGGSGSYNGSTGDFNDLWMFAPSTGLWTWISGDSISYQNGIYGTKGVPGTANKPGARLGAVGWSDALGNLWLFGGHGTASSSGSLSILSDLWSFNISSNLWTWINGSSTTVTAESTPVFGTKGVPDESNKPGGRMFAAGWTDAAGNMWLFGGNRNISSTVAIEYDRLLNDLWKYTPTTSLWTWMSGDSIQGQFGVYGTKGTASNSNKPGSRAGAIGVSDPAGNLMLFGGYTNPALSFPYYNDVWKYDIAAGQWTWLSNDSTPSRAEVYGTKGVGSPDNKPGGREGAASWTDGLGRWRIFGGGGFSGLYNDLWEYLIPSSVLPVRFSSFTAQKQQQTVLLSWTTAQEQNSRHFVVERSSDGLHYDSIGIIEATSNASSTSNYHFIDNKPGPATNYYRLRQTDQDGKSLYSSVIKVSDAKTGFLFAVVQNPVQSTLQLSLKLPADQKFTLQIRDVKGQLVIKQELQGSKGSGVFSVPVHLLKNGIYIVQLITEGMSDTKTFIKQ